MTHSMKKCGMLIQITDLGQKMFFSHPGKLLGRYKERFTFVLIHSEYYFWWKTKRKILTENKESTAYN